MTRSVPALVFLAAAVVPAAADPARCRRAILKSSAKHAQAAVKVLQRCAERVRSGHLPPSTDCGADPALPLARAKLGTGIGKGCCGADHACGNGDDEPLAAVGWDVGQCPDLETLGCDGPIADTVGVAECLACVGLGAADQIVALSLADAPPAPDGSAAADCQQTLGKEVARYARSSAKALARCWDARNRGAHANPCPDPGDGAALDALARAAARLASRAGAACAGAAVGEVTSVEHCPAVTVPDGAACGGAIATLDDLIACLGCLADFGAACVDRAAVPAFASYPPECNPPPGSCSAGVECETSLDCPAGYTCRDNGGGTTRYCVGEPCAGDAECDGGGICRQYCTTEGCGPPACQCPGFGCTGPDELCLDDGGLACRKLCTQDSDCTDPFGLVCVNPGFGFGVCIGTVPCQ